MTKEEAVAFAILRRHYEDGGGGYVNEDEREGVVAKAVKAGADSGLLWPKNRQAIEESVYGFIRHRAENPIDMIAESKAALKDTFPFNLKLSAPTLQRLAEDDLMKIEDLSAWEAENGDLTALSGVGPAAAKKLNAALEDYRSGLEQSDEGKESTGEEEGEPQRAKGEADVLGGEVEPESD